MKGSNAYPLIAEVEAQPDKRLLVRFRNGVTKLYDCKRILALPAFESLRSDETLFRHARADKHGYGVIWNDELDLAESEVWIGGHVVREKRDAYGTGVKQKVAAKRKRRVRIAEDREGATPGNRVSSSVKRNRVSVGTRLRPTGYGGQAKCTTKRSG